VASTWPGLLAAEDVVVWREPAELFRRLSAGLTDSSSDQDAFAAANRLSLEAFRCGASALATAICQAEISYAAARLRRGHHAWTALFGLQPVVNLIRLNGYAGDLGLAREALIGLEDIAGGQPVLLLGLKLSPELLSAIGPAHRRMIQFAIANCVTETAKILWRRRLYDELIGESGRLMDKWPQTAVTGPFHAAEALCLLNGRVPAAANPALRRLCQLHQVARDPAGKRILALDLFRGRARGPAANEIAAARELASLGDSLYQASEAALGNAAMAEAHSRAALADPALANLIRARWLTHTPVVPGPLAAGRLDAGDVMTLSDLALRRFTP
jgi:hypothetical protein